MPDPILHGHVTPADARWQRALRLRPTVGKAINLKASTRTALPLWVRARAADGPAHWLRLTPRPQQTSDQESARDTLWTPDRTGLWTLELALETAPGRAALVPGQTLHAIAENPRFSALRAYTLIPRVAGELAQWQTLLPDLVDMGFNAVWLLPIARMGASQSPYSTSDPLAVESFLAPDGDGWHQARAFADACGRHGLALGVDLVLNHVAPDGLIARQHPEWMAPSTQEEDGLDRSGWREGLGGPFHAWRDLVRLRMEGQSAADKADMLDYWTRYALEWTALSARSAAPMVRLDNAHSTPDALLEAVLPALRRAHPQLSVLGEFFSDTPGAAHAWVWRHGIERLLATPWMEPFADQQRRLLSFLDDTGPKAGLRHFIPLCSHDSPSAAEAYGGPLALCARYAVLAILGGGCTGMVQGTEWSTPKKVEFIGPPGSFAREASQHEAIRAIHAVLAQEGPLDGPAAWLDGDHGAVLGGLRSGPHGALLVAANLDTGADHALHLAAMAGHPWEELFARGCRRDGASLVLAPGGFGIFKAI